VRFSIVALLAAADRAEFGFVRDYVEIDDSTLSKQVSSLERAGYVKVQKGFIGKRARTWLSLTRTGRRVRRARVCPSQDRRGARRRQRARSGGRGVMAFDRLLRVKLMASGARHGQLGALPMRLGWPGTGTRSTVGGFRPKPRHCVS
jgi:DNA-binding MarR family transcriptional regulator